MIKQKLLVLYLSNSSPDSTIIGWSLFDGSRNDKYIEYETSSLVDYKSCLDAMRDGWRVIKYPSLNEPNHENIHQTKFLKYEFVLEKLIESDQDG